MVTSSSAPDNSLSFEEYQQLVTRPYVNPAFMSSVDPDRHEFYLGPSFNDADSHPFPLKPIRERGNLWKEETECLEWLNLKEPNSVVYVNFGSITFLTPQQLVEFAWGLANSKKNFVWINRSDTIVGDSSNLPSEFVEETKERGLIASWCPQEQVLNHPSIGVFLTHCGWNSTIESMSHGMPMICWPFFADQFINCRFSCTEWGVGLEIDKNVNKIKPVTI